jgi:ATP sulfurylase
LVIQTIYRAQSLERVVEAQECTCQTRYPSWDTAIQHFNDNYLGGDRNALREAEEEHFDRFSELRAAARTLCEAEGYW